ncbi:TetR/AcrR family transcriptional regulator [Leptospira biflexa]|uniref:TetR/AcrR family transcriptional regulator n=1 Tax=Leptospira biflexa TaxID=172 RepID=UPI0010916A4F|nr:TetR/AcrR family transcriptional regulator [Leptospira biflexa]TGM43916.1 TetR/AcrR family transcriptional regulator [Leptospira biflexa]TGM44949.1 TetR/AcrR family transcriptional regulator [Leptospira biflexa]
MPKIGNVSNDTLANFPLKERKFAKTRTNLTFGLLEFMESRSYDEIKITELCQYAEISEPTFYHYFPEKDDLILHYIQIWSLMVSVFAKKNRMAESGYGLILSLFRYTANESKKNPKILLEIISFQAKKKRKLQFKSLTEAERILLFPNQDGIETLPIGGIEMLLDKAMYLSKKNKELPNHTNWKHLSLAIASCFFGIPIMAFQLNENLEKLWLETLNYIWLGAGGFIPKFSKKGVKV